MANNNIEASYLGVPMGGSFALDGGMTVYCADAGAFVPVEQAVADPLRRRRHDDLPRGGHGHMSLIHEDDNVHLHVQERRKHFPTPKDEVDFLTTQQQEDMKTCSCCPPKKIS